MDKIQEAFERDSKYLDYTPGDNRTYKDDDTQLRWVWYKSGYSAAKAEPVDPWRSMCITTNYKSSTLHVSNDGSWYITVDYYIEVGNIMLRGYNADPSRDGETRQLVNGEWVEVQGDE